jgi:hypothetical protein
MMHPIISEDIERIVAGVGDSAKKLAGKTVLITGGAGFIGSYIVATIVRLNAGVLDKPCNVISLDNYITGSKKRIYFLMILLTRMSGVLLMMFVNRCHQI